MGTQAKSGFEVLTWEQNPLDGDGVMVTRTTSRHRLTGDVDGEAMAEFLMAHPTESEAEIVGLFRVTGAVGGRFGSFVLRAHLTFSGGAVQGELAVVSGSGTNELSGLSGSGEYRSEGTRVGAITLEYDIA
ncbi:DUF3224 domain-containing protein [Saccharothrix coeruleofusca]|uniref:DUF3224 domain-containing protein n=1 Tax=Saccharothrix coeruleofusca TaxID=33919 RepID=A0A918AKQ2_9PSEU|nr:DUF3224 domain-containing protein [Saccharothrix coeruleofusca]MBP2336624.1 hypothetical protein [Saccharothrix coeruleofusca]GGP51660.1 hypothetical protein GCM10010185_24610 [Saccharothrix coeruleofusca]GGP84980.1 hypothetical protein GCM10010185_68530 [Saccharothrix coeruleofusca]